MREEPKQTLISKTLIAQIEGFIHRNGGDHASFVVGIADDGTDQRAQAHGRLLAEGIRDVRHINSEAELMALGDRSAAAPPPEYAVAVELA